MAARSSPSATTHCRSATGRSPPSSAKNSRGLAHGGIYANGIHCGLIRNTLALISSEDLRRWDVERIVIRSDNPFSTVSNTRLAFDGDDLIAVIRLAVEEPRGLPNRQHDANFLVFKRIERFREPGAAAPDNIRTLHKP